MKSILQYLFLLVSSFIIASCSPKLSADWTKAGYTGKTFQKIAVVGVTDNLVARQQFEDDAVALYQESGINAVKGIDIFPPKMTEEEQKPENLRKLIEQNNLDGVITISLVSTEEGSRYQSGDLYTVPMGYRRFGRYYYNSFSTIQTSGYYVPTKSYLIEAALYDLTGELKGEEESIVWTGQSALIDPSSSESAANSFSKKLVNHTIKKGVILPKTQ